MGIEDILIREEMDRISYQHGFFFFRHLIFDVLSSSYWMEILTDALSISKVTEEP
ncbi:MAG: hypothetical protein HXS41_07895 [Theionarchaea archaeon]|nr:hypothetical protein [Theionarchaea archaeon]MBU7001740.1 hypothetical protein [Theionarchaea archaeon]MBU7020968.1 hypothetical protein [Theionarchaea archaeon]MBU7034394.1 hypothetical protein [Theionarchaea archaeon]